MLMLILTCAETGTCKYSNVIHSHNASERNLSLLQVSHSGQNRSYVWCTVQQMNKDKTSIGWALHCCPILLVLAHLLHSMPSIMKYQLMHVSLLKKLPFEIITSTCLNNTVHLSAMFKLCFETFQDNLWQNLAVFQTQHNWIQLFLLKQHSWHSIISAHVLMNVAAMLCSQTWAVKRAVFHSIIITVYCAKEPPWPYETMLSASHLNTAKHYLVVLIFLLVILAPGITMLPEHLHCGINFRSFNSCASWPTSGQPSKGLQTPTNTVSVCLECKESCFTIISQQELFNAAFENELI